MLDGDAGKKPAPTGSDAHRTVMQVGNLHLRGRWGATGGTVGGRKIVQQQRKAEQEANPAAGVHRIGERRRHAGRRQQGCERDGIEMRLQQRPQRFYLTSHGLPPRMIDVEEPLVPPRIAPLDPGPVETPQAGGCRRGGLP